MIILNKIENRSFGPFASSTGFFLFAGGLIIAYFSLYGLLLAILGAFLSFTSTSTIIDIGNKKIKHADYLFGLLPYGKWVDLQDTMKLKIRKVNRGYVGYARGSQTYEIHDISFRIFLYDSTNKQIMPVQKFYTYDSALEGIKNLGILLQLKNIDT